MVLTERDFAMLCHLGKHGVSTSGELAGLFFPSVLMFRKRVRLLIQENLVRAVPIKKLKELSVQSYRQAASVLGVSTRSLHLVRVYMLADHIRSGVSGSAGLTDVKMWKHQYQVARVSEVLRKLIPDASILSDPEIKREILRYRKIDDSVVPDLVFRSDDYNVAVEIERNYKNHGEYRWRFNYYEDSAYSHVLYFCETEELFERIAERAATYDKVGIVRVLNPDLVFQRSRGFVSLSAFLKIKMETHGG
jgi:hypothetical protein